MKQFLTHWFANLSSVTGDFFQTLFRPVSFSTSTEAIIEVVIGVALLVACAVIARRGKRTPEHEEIWTARRLQFTGIFGTILLLLAFLRYEGIPYVSMQAVLVATLIWALVTYTQLVLYRQLVLKSARSQWRQRKTRDQYLPKPKVRTAR